MWSNSCNPELFDPVFRYCMCLEYLDSSVCLMKQSQQNSGLWHGVQPPHAKIIQLHVCCLRVGWCNCGLIVSCHKSFGRLKDLLMGEGSETWLKCPIGRLDPALPPFVYPVGMSRRWTQSRQAIGWPCKTPDTDFLVKMLVFSLQLLYITLVGRYTIVSVDR